MRNSPEGSRRNTYDFLRLLAAVAVVVQHATVHLDAHFFWLAPRGAWWFYDGVSAFFIISGLFVFRSADHLHQIGASWTDFYVNRLLRIAPAIYAYILVTAILVVAIGAATIPEVTSLSGAAWIGSALALIPVYSPAFLHDFGIGTVNGSLWTIPAEVSFYVIVPILVMAAHRMGQRFLPALAALALLLAFGSGLVGGWPGKFLGISFLPYLWYFGIGIAWYYLRERVPLRWWAAIGSALLYVLITAANRLTGGEHVHLALLAAIPLSYVIICVGERGPRAFQWFTQRVGDLSFGTYVWHMIVVNLMLYSGLRQHLGDTSAVLVAVTGSLLMASLSWHLVERRAISRKRVSSRLQPAQQSVDTRHS